RFSSRQRSAAFGPRQVSCPAACIAGAECKDRAGDPARAIEVRLHGPMESRAEYFQARPVDARADIRAALRFVARRKASHLLCHEWSLGIRNQGRMDGHFARSISQSCGPLCQRRLLAWWWIIFVEAGVLVERRSRAF